MSTLHETHVQPTDDFLTCLSMTERDPFMFHFVRVLISLTRAPHSRFNRLLKILLSDIIALGIRALAYGFRGI